MEWLLRLAEYRVATEYKKGIKNFLVDAISRMDSANHAVVDSDDDLQSYAMVEHKLTTYGAEECQTIACHVDSPPPDTWGDD